MHSRTVTGPRCGRVGTAASGHTVQAMPAAPPSPAPTYAPVAAALQAALGGAWSMRPLHASGFAETWRADGATEALFVKAVPAALAARLAGEADGLQALAATGTVAVPALAGLGTTADGARAWLALGWLDLRPPDAGFGQRLGAALAALHRAPLAIEALAAAGGDGRAAFGWQRDNHLGATPQRNRWCAGEPLSAWLHFVATQRLGALQDRLAARGAPAALLAAVDGVIDRLPDFFGDGYRPRPALIHGDLWAGNWGMRGDGAAVIYDPAVSYSDPEAELAMMELFGNPPPAFWPAYRAAAGLHEGYARRRGLYQLVHLLNHALLFGGGYVAQAQALARRLAA